MNPNTNTLSFPLFASPGGHEEEPDYDRDAIVEVKPAMSYDGRTLINPGENDVKLWGTNPQIQELVRNAPTTAAFLEKKTSRFEAKEGLRANKRFQRSVGSAISRVSTRFNLQSNAPAVLINSVMSDRREAVPVDKIS